MRRLVTRNAEAAPTPLLFAGFLRQAIHSLWNQAARASNTLSETLTELSSGPLYSRDDGVGSKPPSLQSVPLRAVDCLFSRYQPESGQAEPIPEIRIVEEANSYFLRVPGRGVILNDLVAHIVDRTGYRSRGVRQVILGNFPSHGELVWKK